MRKARFVSAILVVTFVLAGAVSLCGHLYAEPETKDLGRGVPEGAWLYFRQVHNPERDYMSAYWEDIRATYAQTGIREELTRLLSGLPAMAAGQELQEQLGKWRGLVEKVNWKSFVEKEIVCSLRFQKELPIPELLVLSRLDAAELANNREAFQAIFTEISSSNPELSVSTSQVSGAEVVMLLLPGSPVTLTVATRDDVFLFSTSARMTSDSLSLLAGGAGSSILDSPRFKEALTHLPSPEDGETFIDVANLFTNLRRLPALAAVEAPSDPDAQLAVGIIDKLLNHFDVVDYVASVRYTEGHTNLSEAYAKLKPDANASGIYSVFANQPLIQDFQTFIPQDAVSFSVSSGLDLHALYKFIEGFIAEELPNGAELLVEWETVQQQNEFHLDAELLSALGGGIISFQVPAAVPNPMQPVDTVFMLKVKDKAKVEQLTDRGLVKAKEHFQGQNVMFSVLPAPETGGYPFKAISMQFMPMLQPAYGFVDDYLVIASSAGAAGKLVSVKEGKTPNVLSSPKLAKLEALPQEPVTLVYYANLQSQIQQQAQAVGMMGMWMAFIPESPETAPMKSLMMLLPRLAPVIKKFDFLQDQLVTIRFDRATGTWKSKRVISIRPPVQ